MARCIGVPRGQRPRARTVAPCAGTGRSPARPGQSVPRDASGSLRTHADDERTGEVGPTRSTGEVSEQRRATGGGGDGGKGSGQREPASAKRVPDTEPERRAQCAGAGTSGSKRRKKLRFTALLHHIYNLETLRWAYLSLKREAAAGVDGETWRHYGESLEENLRDLSERLKRGAYRAKPVRRVYIPKADGRQRPLGVTALEDKIAQRATVEVLNAIYETDFLSFSYGFRPGRSPHHALDALYTRLLTEEG